MKKELQTYLADTFGHQYDNLELDVCASANPFVRFDLGGEDNNDKKERVSQATKRAIAIFGEVFPETSREVTVLIYDYLYADEYKSWGILGKYFPKEKFTEIYSDIETRIESDEEDEKVRVIIGKIRIGDIDSGKLFQAIANTEMGFEPALYSRVFFLDQESDTIFYMYDDRGCIVETRDVERLRSLHASRKDWLSDDYEEKMDRYFVGE